MAVGRSAVLAVTNSQDRHTDLVMAQLLAAGGDVLRLDADQVPFRGSAQVAITGGRPTISFDVGDRRISGDQIGAVWYRQPVPPVPPASVEEPQARELVQREFSALVGGAVRLLCCTWINHPAAIEGARPKVVQLECAAEVGFEVPETLVSTDPTEIRRFFGRCDGRMVGKLIGGQVPVPDPDKRYAVFTSSISEADLADDAVLSLCPALYQERLQKDYELRVTVVGDETFTCRIDSQDSEITELDWRRGDLDTVPHRRWDLDGRLQTRCVELTRQLGLTLSAIDLVVTPDGRTVFLDLNGAGPAWGWIEEGIGLPVSEAIARRLLTGVTA